MTALGVPFAKVIGAVVYGTGDVQIGQVRRVRTVYLFGSHARGEARPDSDVDLCIVADGAEEQFQTATEFRRAMWLRLWRKSSRLS